MLVLAMVSGNESCSSANLVRYSILCLSPDPPDDCYPQDSVRTTADILLLVNFVLGILGNALTLLAIPYVMHKNRQVTYLFCPPSVARWAEVGEGGSGGKLKLRQKVGAVGNR